MHYRHYRPNSILRDLIHCKDSYIWPKDWYAVDAFQNFESSVYCVLYTSFGSMNISTMDTRLDSGCLGGAVVRRQTRDRKVAGSTPGRGAISK